MNKEMQKLIEKKFTALKLAIDEILYEEEERKGWVGNFGWRMRVAQSINFRKKMRKISYE